MPQGAASDALVLSRSVVVPSHAKEWEEPDAAEAIAMPCVGATALKIFKGIQSRLL